MGHESFPGGAVLHPIRLAYKPYFFSQRTVFFSHNKSVNSTFSHGLSAKRTGPLFVAFSSIHYSIIARFLQPKQTTAVETLGMNPVAKPLPPSSKNLNSICGRKSLLCLPQLSQKSVFPPCFRKPDITPPSSFQTGHMTSLAVSLGGFFSFIFILLNF